MVIGIDASRAFLPRRTGIEEYSYQLIKHLRTELAGERVVLYIKKLSAISYQQSAISGQPLATNEIDFELPRNWEVRELWAPRVWTQGGLALEMLLHPPDVLLVPAHTVPWIHPKKTVVVVHGLEYEVCPEAYSRWERFYMRFSIRNSCQWASRIIAVSENTKRDLMRLYEVAEEKIRVVYEGVAHIPLSSKSKIQNSKFQIHSRFQILDGTELVLGNQKLGTENRWRVSDFKPYFLFIGRIETRKNVGRILEAFDMFKKKCGTNHKLVLAGKPGFGHEVISSQLSALSSREDIIELGYVSEEEKWELLRGAEVFLFPSLYEGFGLPVLEAQLMGVPVITSNISSLPEVVGDAATLVDPLSIERIARGMEKIALDGDFRSGIIERGLRNVGRFSWEKCAKEVVEVLLG